MARNPTQGPYTYTSPAYHSGNPGTYNRAVLATAPYYATGSVTTPQAFYISGSTNTATVTLLNGGQIQLTAAAGSPAVIHQMSIYSVDAGTVYLLYR